MANLESDLKTLQQSAVTAIATCEDLNNLDQLRVKYLGKKGELSLILKGMGKLSGEERPRIGAIANEVKEALQGQIEVQKTALQAAAIEAQLQSETLDVTMPGVMRPLGRKHPLNSTVDRVLEIFVGLGYTVAGGPSRDRLLQF